MRINLLPTQPTGAAASPAGPILSALAHLALVVATVVGPSREELNQRFDEVVPEGLTFLVPPSTSPASAAPQVRFEQGAGDDGTARDGELADDGARRAGTGDGDAAPVRTLESSAAVESPSPGASEQLSQTFQVLDVDSAAVREPDSAAPIYPPELMATGVEGWAAVRFVVDSTGRVDLSTIETLGFTNPAFWDAVRTALPKMRFRPAMMQDRPVRQLAEQMFRFEILPADSLAGTDTIARTRTPRPNTFL